MSRYPGDRVQKKIARAIAYDAAARECSDAEGGVVCLAGPGAHDVGPLMEFIKPRPDQVLFVDMDEAGLQRARERMPGCHTFHGPLANVVLPWRVKLAVLDFCGLLQGENFSGAMAVVRRLSFGGVVLLSTYRAREQSWHGVGRDIRRAGPITEVSRTSVHLGRMAGAAGVRPHLAGSEVNLIGVRKRAAMTDRVLAFLGAIDYQVDHTPMAIELFRLERWIDAQRRSTSSFCEAAHSMPDGLGRQLSQSVYRLRVRRGHGPAEIVQLGFGHQAFDVSPGTLAAWKAHRTMGTYDARRAG